ncbi:MAG: aminodeoxychorismate/anthranilate synthase component II [Hymenobacter sp.]
MLGVCLGQQALGEVAGPPCGGPPAHARQGGRHRTTGFRPLAGRPTPRQAVTRYHSLVLEAGTLPAVARPLAVSADAHRELMALRHATLPLYGVQFHPEALLTTHGLRWLANWLRCCNIA